MRGNKSKLFTKVLALAMIVVLGVFALTACDLFGGDSNSSSNSGTNSNNNSNSNNSSNSKPSSAEIVVYTDGAPAKYTATYGEQLDLGVLVKFGYMIDNVTDSNGNIYFDNTGKSMSVWQETFPTVFYANFIPVGNLSYSYSTWWTEQQRIWTLSYRNDNQIKYGFNDASRRQFNSAIRGNLSRKIKVTVSYRERGESATNDLVFRMIVRGDEIVYENIANYKSGTYKTTTQVIELTANSLLDGFTLYWGCSQSINAVSGSHYIKDVNVTIQFI